MSKQRQKTYGKRLHRNNLDMPSNIGAGNLGVLGFGDCFPINVKQKRTKGYSRTYELLRQL